MNRKQFIESQEATCDNWTWSWSFINEQDKVIIFGAWDIHTEGSRSLILSKNWQLNRKGRKQPAYRQSREHIRLIEEEGFQLKTFPIIYSDSNLDDDGIGPSKIESFTPQLTTKILIKIESNWYADETTNRLTEEIDTSEQYLEGASKTVIVNKFERDPSARAKCIENYGYTCAVCSFDFEKFYGLIGREYIHVHHVRPLAEIRKEYELNPITDLIPVCPNCHAMIHRTRKALTVEELKNILAERKNKT
jgi:5-methylcytosine-specific restriction protein A